MKIANSSYDDRIKDNQEHLRRLNQTLEKQVTNKEAEIKKVGEIYDKKVEASKLEGEKKYAQNMDDGQQRILEESKTF